MGGNEVLQTTLIKDSDIEPLADGVLTVLEKVGILCQNEETLRALEQAGARVDYESERATFPKQMTAEFVEHLRAGQATGDEQVLPFDPPGLPGIGTQIAQFYYDHKTGEARSSNREDFITLTKLGDVLHGDKGVGHSLSMTDVPPLLEPLQAALLLAEYAHVPGAPFAWDVRQVDYLREMGQVLGREDWASWGAVCFAHPLRFDRDTVNKFARRVREGVSTGLTAMPVAGASTPVTIEGFVVVSSAENIATWMAVKALNPDCGIGGGMWAGTVDMKTGDVSYSAPDAMIYGFAASEFMRRWCGMFVPVGGGEYCDAVKPGLYAAIEKAYKAMTIAAFQGRHPGIGEGMLDEGCVLAPVQLMLERDLIGGVGHLSRTVDACADNIGLDEILDVGIGLRTNHLQTEHTVRHFRSSLWLPELIDRSGWKGAADDARMLDQAQGQVDELLSQYTKPEGREDQLAAMRAIADRARAELLG